MFELPTNKLNIRRLVQVKEGITSKNIETSVLNSEQPVVLKGFSNNWHMVKLARQNGMKVAAHLQSKHVGKEVNVSLIETGGQERIFYNSDFTGFNFTTLKMPFSKVLSTLFEQQALAQPQTVYMPSTSIPLYFPDLVTETLVNGMQDSIFNLWLGNRTRVAAHYDFLQNLACVVAGRRRFILFPPDQIGNLYPGPLHLSPGGREISLVNFAEPDFQTHPKFKQALQHAMLADLSPGDALVIPSMWWHHVEAADPFNVLLNHWWRNSPAYLGGPANALMLSLLSIRDLPPAQKQAWQALFEHYVFHNDAADFAHIPEAAQGALASPLNEQTARQLRANIHNKLRR